VAQCTVERLMGNLGLRGAVRGKTRRTITADETDSRPAGVASVGSRGDSFDNALAERIIGLYRDLVGTPPGSVEGTR
jgi:hypothetical protein